jgi:hypothetical protein
LLGAGALQRQQRRHCEQQVQSDHAQAAGAAAEYSHYKSFIDDEFSIYNGMAGQRQPCGGRIRRMIEW